MKTPYKPLFYIVCFGLSVLGFCEPFEFWQPEVHGYFEMRSGMRLRHDQKEKKQSVMESRMQLEMLHSADWFDLKLKGDVFGDYIQEKGDYDLREAWVFMRPLDCMDVNIGRQVLTWGTGDWVFLNDLFPKDWQSFFIGRDLEYMKAPCDALKVSLFSDYCNLDMVYCPRFHSDRYITGEYLSRWNGSLQRITGQDSILRSMDRDRFFSEDEMAWRLYKNIDHFEYAMYGYQGFWKGPTGEKNSGKHYFPELSVYGASARGSIFHGIGNAEIAWYHSSEDSSGNNCRIPNSQMRYLIGYTREIARDCNLSVQYYIEQKLQYSQYEKSMGYKSASSRFRNVVTVQLTKLMMNQNVELSLPLIYSPDWNDGYFRPSVSYNYSDNVQLSAGVNWFFGGEKDSPLGQYEQNSNIYVSFRYLF